MRPDIMMVGLTTDDLCDTESRIMKNCKANQGRTLLKDMIGLQKFTVLEIDTLQIQTMSSSI